MYATWPHLAAVWDILSYHGHLSIYLSTLATQQTGFLWWFLCVLYNRPFFIAPQTGREGGGAWMEPAPEQREVEGRGGAFWYEVPH